MTSSVEVLQRAPAATALDHAKFGSSLRELFARIRVRRTFVRKERLQSFAFITRRVAGGIGLVPGRIGFVAGGIG